jgi:hypothetical protein
MMYGNKSWKKKYATIVQVLFLECKTIKYWMHEMYMTFSL